jgi:serine/threonine-protein kinase
MTLCPPPELLQRLLADRASDAEEKAAGAHVEDCPNCQRVLETLTASEATDATVPASAGGADEDPLGEGELQRLRHLLCSATPHYGAGPALAAPASAEWPTVPGYEILDELGCGGMGVVYKARQLRLNRLVALKLVRAETTPQRRLRYLVEGEVLARLQHPNVVRIYDVGSYRGQAYFALELVEGGSLADKLDGKRLPAREAARLVACLAQAVQAAHAQNIVHRDLKPANVLLTTDGVPKLTDFGLAKTLDVDLSLTRTGEVLGTPAYMAPEQALGQAEQVGPLTDVYALGVILYETLTGRPPFLATSYPEVLQQVSWDDPVPPRRLQPQVPRDLETICLRCLQKEPGRRYGSGRELADDLQRFLENRVVVARPSGPVEKLARSCRRNPLSASLLAVIVLVLLPAFAGMAWQWRVAETARAAAMRELDSALWRESRASMAAVPDALQVDKADFQAAFNRDGTLEATGSVGSEGGRPRTGAYRDIGDPSPQGLP